MWISRPAALLLLVAVGSIDVGTQAPAAPPPAGPTFDVVSVKPNTSGAFGSTVNERPDGGFTMSSLLVAVLIGRAYPPAVPADVIGLPGWAMSERDDFSATSTLPRATPEQRTAMLRALLVDRFELAVHFEKREQPVYDLVLARSDGRLGPGLQPGSNVDCEARAAAQRAAAEAARAAGVPAAPPPRPDMTGSMPQCSFRMLGARMAGIRGPDPAPQADGPPSVFTAVQEQLGWKLAPSTADRDTLVIDRLERPTEN